MVKSTISLSLSQGIVLNY